ncbi:cytidine deaminase [Haloferula sargassicola]|uniref:Cytidine deaminase n=1 Tax=Haloferula sargassicola TaxID=490096 RepID=A0ABP9UPK0_9BACT
MIAGAREFRHSKIMSEVDAWIRMAWEAREAAYAPYSKFKVGAVVVGEGGEVFRGCNVENLSYGLTQCAERVAIGAGVVAGERVFRCVVVVAETAVPISPCGACRQVLAEFGDPEVWLVNRETSVRFRLSELLPRARSGILDLP